METFGWLLLTGLVCFGWGFASNYEQWSKRAINGSLVEVKGKIYKIVEVEVEVDVAERGES